jgi:endonuclease/exonuclease/phosphatase family metal-dependent hydrolase
VKALAPVLVAVACGATPPASHPPNELRVLTLNVQLDGHDQLSQIADAVRRARADIVFLQECGAAKCGEPLAKMLGESYVQQGDDTATYARWPIDAEGRVQPPGGPRVRVRNLHLYYTPYQPYQLLHIPYEDTKFVATPEEAIAEARAARGKEVDTAVAALASDPLVIAGGDFNEPSHLDWTAATAAAGRQPAAVAWPSTKAFAEAGFVDAYRAIYPDPVAHPGFTWTPTTSPDDPKDHHDRIDFLLARGLRPIAAEIVGEDATHADIVIAPYPTDHRGVVAVFALPSR